ncbi:MAG: hypothetical protein ABEI77_07560 [Halorientalis sp.]
MVTKWDFWSWDTNSIKSSKLARTVVGGLVLNLLAGFISVILGISSTINTHILSLADWMGGLVGTFVAAPLNPITVHIPFGSFDLPFGPLGYGVSRFITVFVNPAGPFGLIVAVVFMLLMAWIFSLVLRRVTDG